MIVTTNNVRSQYCNEGFGRQGEGGRGARQSTEYQGLELVEKTHLIHENTSATPCLRRPASPHTRVHSLASVLSKSQSRSGVGRGKNKNQDTETNSYADDVYDLAEFWYNVEDFTYSLVDDLNSTLLAKLAAVSEKVSDMEHELAEKDEQIASLREALDNLQNDTKSPSVGDVRLYPQVEGLNHVRGRLLIYAGETLGWGYVCDDLFYSTSATVACRQLGYSRGVTDTTQQYLALINNSQFDIVLDDVQCRPTDTDLLACSHEPLGVHNCLPLEAVSIVCYR
ncbi:hhip-like 1 [Plakobranchus ocellatus]|uniref:Hhip-like 1 n=1 Tax=Plakobranchus ocellatus TaxID=259542 RepID=A0AAV4A0E4_9GAST|nr:hhip-like 1 [Plakobranchus ocellatus]